MGGVWDSGQQGQMIVRIASWIPYLTVSPCNSVQVVFSPFGQRYSLLAAAQSAAGVSVPNIH